MNVERRHQEMKILYVIEHISTIGGLERILIEKMNALSRQCDMEVMLMTVWKDDAVPAFPIDDAVKHYCLNIEHPASTLEMVMCMPRIVKSYNKHVAELAPDVVVHFRAIGALLIAFSTWKGYTVFEAHGARHHNNHTWLYPLMERRVDAVVCLTTKDAANYKKAKEVVVIPNFTTMTPSCSIVDYDREHCIFAGRLCYEKDPLRLLQIWKRVAAHRPSWILDIYGSGEMEMVVSDSIEQLGLQNHVVMHGQVGEMSSVYTQGSVLLLTSRTEGLPMVLIEAMRCGLPVVSTDCPYGPSDIVRNGENGMLVPLSDDDAFVESLLTMMDSVDLRRQMGEKAKETSALFAMDKIIGQWVSFFKSRTK